MSDFLTDLAARSSGSAAVIRPRLPSRFEPPRLALDLSATDKFAASEQPKEMEEEVSRPSDAQTAPARRSSPVGAPQAQSRAASGAVLPAPPADRLAVETSVARQGETPPGPVGPQVRPTLQPSVPQTDMPPNPLRASFDAGLLASREVAVGPDSHQADRVQGPAPVAVTASDSSNDRVRAAGPSTPSIESTYVSSDQIAQLVRSIIQSRVASSEEDAARRGDRAPRSNASEPAVQVTIGRIEVRATSQPHTAPRERPGSPPMSLDEYLRKKRAGA
jgi:hypothetical protein